MFVEMLKVNKRRNAVRPAGLGEREEIGAGARTDLGVDLNHRYKACSNGADRAWRMPRRTSAD
jgi:hypothetical protein